MYILFLAGRYTLVRPVSYLAMVAIGLAVMALIVVVSIMNGFLDETRAYLRGTTADIIVSPVHPADQPVPREQLEQIIAAHPSVVGASSRFFRPAVFKMSDRSDAITNNSKFAGLTQVSVYGVDPELEEGITDFRKYITDVDDTYQAVDDPTAPFDMHRGKINNIKYYNAGNPHALFGMTLLRQLGLSKGDAVELVTVPEGAAFDGDEIRSTTQTFIIAGGFESGHHTFDQSSVYIPASAFRIWANVRHEVSELAVRLDEEADFDKTRDELLLALNRAGIAASVETWRDRHEIWLNAVENERNILIVIFFFFLLLVCTISYSVLTMMVQGKTRDIGILSAMGAPARGVGRIFAMCGIYIATLGGLFGLLTGWLLAENVNAVKDVIESLLGIEIFSKEVYAFSEIPTTVIPLLNFGIAGATIVGAVVICLFPAWRAARLDPVVALRHE